MDQPSFEKVAFESGPNRLIGKLFRSSSRSGPAILVTGSWTTVKEQMADRYAVELARRGLATMTFDFAHFGESAGEPRQQESPSQKRADIVAASNWLAGQEGVSAVGGLAICASAGYMAQAIAAGAPITAFAAVAA